MSGKRLQKHSGLDFAFSRLCRGVARKAGTVAPSKPTLGKHPTLSRVTGVAWPVPSHTAGPVMCPNLLCICPRSCRLAIQDLVLKGVFTGYLPITAFLKVCSIEECYWLCVLQHDSK